MRLKVFFFVYAFLVFGIFSFTNSLAYQEEPLVHPWTMMEDSFFDGEEGLPEYFLQVDQPVCNYDSLDSVFCLEVAERQSCFYLFILFDLNDEHKFTFSPTKLPNVFVDSNPEGSLTNIPELEEAFGHVKKPTIVEENQKFWIHQVGSFQDIKNAKNGLFYQLMHGKMLNIFFTLDDGSIRHSEIHLIDIKPYLVRILLKAKEKAQTHSQCYKGLD